MFVLIFIERLLIGGEDVSEALSRGRRADGEERW
jgi:hypothetical protein